MPKDWRPDGWEDWSYERRRIWRLEHQLRRWEALSFSARALAYELASAAAELRGEDVPSIDEIDDLIFNKARTHWNLPPDEAADVSGSLEDESAKNAELDAEGDEQ